MKPDGFKIKVCRLDFDAHSQCNCCGQFYKGALFQVCIGTFWLNLCDECARKLASKLNTECR